MGSSVCKVICPPRNVGRLEIEQNSGSEPSNSVFLGRPALPPPIQISRNPASQNERQILDYEPVDRLQAIEIARQGGLLWLATDEARQPPPNKTVKDIKEPFLQNQNFNNPGLSSSGQ